jgi:lysophospholipase L1-like esterase
MIYGDVELHNVTDVLAVPDKPGVRLQRLPDAVRHRLNETAEGVALCPSSCEVRFVTDAREARVTLHSDIHHEYVHVFRGDFFHSEVMLNPGETREITLGGDDEMSRLFAANGVPTAFSPHVWRLRLSGTGRVHFVSIDAGDATLRPPRPDEKPATRWLAYGSSITHGFSASRLANPYIIQAARRLGVDVLNLGFGGSCHAEPAIVDYFAARDDWDLVTCELGINLVEHPMPLEEATDRFTYLARTLAADGPGKRAGRALVLITAFPCKSDLRAGDDPRRLRLAALRDAVRTAHAECGRDDVTLLEGPELLPDWSGLTTDLVHPSDHGMSVIGDRLADRLRSILPVSRE